MSLIQRAKAFGLSDSRQHGESGRAYPAPADTYLLGLCTGALAAAAISSSKTLSELLPVAVQTVLVSFRLGLCVVDLRNRLELSPDNSASWSMVVPGLTAEAAATGLKEHSQARVCDICTRWEHILR